MKAPHRTEPEPDPELDRLAAQGHARRRSHDSEHQESAQAAAREHLHAAIGSYRGSSRSSVPLLVALAGFAAVFAAIVFGAGLRPLGVIGAFVAFLSLFVWKLSPPKVSPEEIEAERAWATSFPFALHGYFDVLSQQPRASRSLAYELRWSEGTAPPERSLLEGICAAADPGARVERIDAQGARIRSGAVSGDTGTRINRQPVYRNHELPAHVHGVVETALVPLHRQHAVASVTLSDAAGASAP